MAERRSSAAWVRGLLAVTFPRLLWNVPCSAREAWRVSSWDLLDLLTVDRGIGISLLTDWSVISYRELCYKTPPKRSRPRFGGAVLIPICRSLLLRGRLGRRGRRRRGRRGGRLSGRAVFCRHLGLIAARREEEQPADDRGDSEKSNQRRIAGTFAHLGIPVCIRVAPQIAIGAMVQHRHP